MKKIILLLVLPFMTMAQSTLITPGVAGNIQIPNLTYSQITAIPSPVRGMKAYDTDYGCERIYNGTQWRCHDTPENQSNVLTTAFKANSGTPSAIFYVMNEVNPTDNSTIVVGNFIGSITFGSTTLTSAGGQDIFIAKFSSSNALLWANRIGGAGNGSTLLGDEYVTDIVQEIGSSNFYLTGRISSASVTGAITGSAVNGSDGFIAKFDPSGNNLWVNYVNGTVGTSYDGFLTMSQFGSDLYVCGYQSGGGVLGSTSLSATQSRFVAKYTQAGALQWVSETTGNIHDLKATASKIIAVGSFTSSITLGSSSFTSVGSLDAFITSFDSATGAIQWSDAFGSLNMEYPRAIVIKNNKAVILGDYSGTINWGGTTINRLFAYDTFIAQYDLNGGKEWIKSINGTGDDIIIDAKTDLIGNIYLLTSIGQQASFENVSINTNNSFNTVLAKLSPSGICVWAKKYFSSLSPINSGGLSQIQLINGLAKVTMSGNFQGTNVQFGHSKLTSTTPGVFLATITEN
jgi:hypothetical protein